LYKRYTKYASMFLLQPMLLHLLSIDHDLHQDRRYRLTDVHGDVVRGVLA